MANTDKRTERHPVARFEVAQFTIVNGSSAAIEQPCPMNGRLVAHALVGSDVTNGITYTLKILDEDDIELYSVAALAENSTTLTDLTRDNDVFIPDGCAVTVTPSGDPGSAGTVDIVLYGV